MKKKQCLALIVALCVIFSLAITGCGGDNQPAASGSGEAEKVLRVARNWEKTTMDPATWSTHTDIAYATSVFETLLTYDNNLNPTGKLAEKWGVSDDGLTYTFTLRQGVEFHHDYGEMKASDAVYTIERMKDPDVNASNNASNLNIDNMKSITAEGDYTVKIVLNEEDPNFLYKFCEHYAYIVSQKAVEELGLEGFNKSPVGTGPFAFDKGIAGERTEIVKHEKYWGEKAKLDRIIFQILVEPATMFNAFESGEIDFMGLNDSEKILQYKQDPRFEVYGVPSRYDGALGMNVQIPPLDNIKVRMAVAHAINREEIINDYYLGLETAPKSVFPQGAKFVTNNNFNIEYNPERAKELLAEAGYPDGFEIDYYCPNDQLSMEPSTLIQYYLSQVGIKANLNTVDFGVFLSQVGEGKAPFWYLINGPDIIPDSWFLRFTSDFAPGRNWVCLTDEEYDSYVKQGLAAKDEKTKAHFYALAQNRFADLLPLVPINTSGAFVVMSEKVKGFEVKPNLIFSHEKLYFEE